MKIIYKYFYPMPSSTGFIPMPVGAEVLCVQEQNGCACIWALVDPKNEIETRSFFLVGTGEPMPDNPSKYIGTFQLSDGRYVGHIFELIK